ncbi:MAG: DUF3726 domain-containing protein [Pseudoruegeria sp.]
MSYSLNEIEALSKRATRGAGYPWGLAEDAAKATRWLCLQGFDGVDLLSHVLIARFADTITAHSPKSNGDVWQANVPLCPLSTGTQLSDYAAILRQHPVAIKNVAVPAFILPFVANAAKALNEVVSVRGASWSAVSDGSVLNYSGTCPSHPDTLDIEIGGAVTSPQPQTMRAHPNGAALQTLQTLAQNTYAPATEASRRLGAGDQRSPNA